MSDNAVSAFKRLTAALESLDRVAAQEPEHSRELAVRLAEGYARADQTHSTLLDYLQQFSRQWDTGRKELAAAGQHTGDRLAHYRERREQSALETANELEGSQNEADTLGEILYRGLDGLQQQLAEWDGAETAADSARHTALLDRRQWLARGDGVLAGIEERLQGAGGATRAGVTSAERQATDGAWRQAAALNRQAIHTYLAGRARAALALLEQAVRLAPADATIHLNLARLYAGQELYAEAEEECRQAEALLPAGAPAVAYTRGLLALQQSAYARAVELLTQAAAGAAGPGEEAAYRLSLAEACYRAGHPEPALAQWRRVLALDPGQPVARAALQMLEQKP